jgi:hypothetical protein
MQENCPYGSEGGAAKAVPTPIKDAGNDGFRWRSTHPTANSFTASNGRRISRENPQTVIEQECPHFREWIASLRRLSQAGY